jgi:hypothetical protein
MTEQTNDILDSMMGGTSIALLQFYIEQLSRQDRKELLCVVCSLRDEIAANCVERAQDCDYLLLNFGHSLPPSCCGIREIAEGGCPRLLGR